MNVQPQRESYTVSRMNSHNQMGINKNHSQADALTTWWEVQGVDGSQATERSLWVQ